MTKTLEEFNALVSDLVDECRYVARGISDDYYDEMGLVESAYADLIAERDKLKVALKINDKSFAKLYRLHYKGTP